MEKHELLCAVKSLALELGRTPTRPEFLARIQQPWRHIKQFGGFSTLLQAAGLEPNYIKEKKIDNSVFNVNLTSHLEQLEPPKRVAQAPFPMTGVISDIHWPFHDPKVLAEFIEFATRNQPEYLFINGDAWDMYSHAKFPRSHNIFSPREEERLAHECNKKFWEDLRRAVPKAVCVQMMGNHDVRPMKRVLEQYPEAEDWIRKKLMELFTFEGVKTVFDPREEYMLTPNTAVFHGYRSKLGDHRDYTLMNTMNGHSHLGGAVYRQIRGQVLWELNSGLSGNPFAKGLTYTPQKLTHWTPGFGWLWPWGPQFIPI